VSVVESDWESLKRFNLAELYSSQRTPKAAAASASASDGAKPQNVIADEAAAVAAPSVAS
jgi:hypothetical protein